MCAAESIVYPTQWTLTISGNEKVQSLCRTFGSHSELGRQTGLEHDLSVFRTTRLAKFILTLSDIFERLLLVGIYSYLELEHKPSVSASVNLKGMD